MQRNAKYYVVDSAFRKFLLSRTDSDRGHILENIVYLELIRRGYRVYVGHLQNGESRLSLKILITIALNPQKCYNNMINCNQC